MKNSQQHLGNEANLATFSLSHDVIFLMVSPLLGRVLVSLNLQSAICGLQSPVCSLQSANVIHRNFGGKRRLPLFQACSASPVIIALGWSQSAPHKLKYY